MDEPSLRDAILKNPEDDSPRLLYADWLATCGQFERAEWIRASCQYAKLNFGDAGWNQTGERMRELWGRCRPPWWEELANIEQKNDRGMFRFILGGSRSARNIASIKRLNKALWIEQAMQQGWLLRIEAWVDEDLIDAISKWNKPVSMIPLFVTAAPQAGNEALRKIFRLPQLQGLDLPSNVLREDVANEVADCANLRDLTLEFRLVDPAKVDILLASVAAMPMLRRLCLKGHELAEYGTRPNDADLIQLARMTGLKRLALSTTPAVTDAGITELRRLNPSLIVDRHFVP